MKTQAKDLQNELTMLYEFFTYENSDLSIDDEKGMEAFLQDYLDPENNFKVMMVSGPCMRESEAINSLKKIA